MARQWFVFYIHTRIIQLYTAAATLSYPGLHVHASSLWLLGSDVPGSGHAYFASPKQKLSLGQLAQLAVENAQYPALHTHALAALLPASDVLSA